MRVSALVLAPLSKGEHTIHLRVETSAFGGYFSETTYHLTVE
jgi:hypothetical protein